MNLSIPSFLATCILTGFLLMGSFSAVIAQPIPGSAEGIPFLVTFGKGAQLKWGDDDFSQVYFFAIPEDVNQQVYIRVFDPNIGGEHDEARGGYNTKTSFEVYGGRGTITPKAAQSADPVTGYDSGILMASKTFDAKDTYDGKWYTFGPFNPKEGEHAPDFGGYIFKVIAKGISGDDGNLYRYFLSSSGTKNIPLEGGNGFTYECSFRMPNKNSVCHIYPYINPSVVSIKQYNFDWDGDGKIRIVSSTRRGEEVSLSGDGNWASSKHMIQEGEKGGSLDIQIIKLKGKDNNNLVFRVTNQYDEAMAFFTAPIGGIPKFGPKINVKPKR